MVGEGQQATCRGRGRWTAAPWVLYTFKMSQTASPRRTLVHNERMKLAAATLDRAATACFVVGVIAPVQQLGHLVPAAVMPWIVAGLVLHLGAQAPLEFLR